MKSARLLGLEVVGVMVRREEKDVEGEEEEKEDHPAKVFSQIRLALEAARLEGHKRANVVDLGPVGEPNEQVLLQFGTIMQFRASFKSDVSPP